MRISLFHKIFIFLTIFTIIFKTTTANDLSEIELEKRCDKRERLMDEKDKEPLSSIKVHKNYLDALLKRLRSNAENVTIFMNVEYKSYKKSH